MGCALTQRVSSWVVLLDKIDCLFGALMSSRETGGALAHQGVIPNLCPRQMFFVLVLKIGGL